MSTFYVSLAPTIEPTIEPTIDPGHTFIQNLFNFFTPIEMFVILYIYMSQNKYLNIYVDL